MGGFIAKGLVRSPVRGDDLCPYQRAGRFQLRTGLAGLFLQLLLCQAVGLESGKFRGTGAILLFVSGLFASRRFSGKIGRARIAGKFFCLFVL
jgi:hypothetical protein